MAPTNLRERVRGFHARALKESARQYQSMPDKLLPGLETLRTLRLAYEDQCSQRGLVGRMPPRPNTLRARIGAHLVGLVQRMLFWYTPQILRFHNASTVALEATCVAFEKQMEVLQCLVAEIEDLRSELRVQNRISIGPEPGGAHRSAGRSAALDIFEFDVRNKLHGPPESAQSYLNLHLETILNLAPGPPEGPWIDLGCGRGDWCSLLTRAGREVCGIEPNSKAADHCRRAGLVVEQRDCLEFLRSAPSHSFSVITAFHELERHPFPHVFETIWQAARTLKPGGFLVIEAANPANILESSHGFWQDPQSSRILPVATSESLLWHFGFQVISRKELNQGAAEDRFPLAELDVVKKLNHHFYGAASYALIGRSGARSRPSDQRSD